MDPANIDVDVTVTNEDTGGTMPVAEPYELTETKHGLMLVNRNDYFMGQSLLVYGECSELELMFLLTLAKNPGEVVEVGANMGIHTIPLGAALAKEGRTLYAFEPQPVIFQQLCANLALNGLTNVRALPYACGSKNGALTFDIPDYTKLGNFGGTELKEVGATTSKQELVQCVRLDDLLSEGKIGLLKIDVEGLELEVLRGCEGLLARCRPFLYVENDRVKNSPALIQWLFDHEYRLWWHLPPLFNPQNYRGIKENRYGPILSFNMLGLHKSNTAQLSGLVEVLDPNSHPIQDAS
jgi:FkbM family methyltransferase